MELLGKILIEGAVDDFIEKWSEVIDQCDFLIRPPSRSGTNPFTLQPIEFYPPSSTARIVTEAKIIGHIFMAEDGSPFLWVTYSYQKEIVAQIAKRIAQELKCKFLEEKNIT